MYTPPVTPRKLATPEAGGLTGLEVRGQKSEVGKRKEFVDTNSDFNSYHEPLNNLTSDILHLTSRSERAVEGGAGDWGEVVTR